MNRQDLAMKLYVRDGFNPKEAFDAADLFIAEAERQKAGQSVVERCEPKACEHAKLYRDAHGNCRKCGALLWGAEASKPERVAAREWDATVSPNGWVIDNRFHFNSEATGMKVIRVREILPGDEK